MMISLNNKSAVNNSAKVKPCSGFTLIEMMITVVVIGIVAIVAIPSYQEYIRYGDTNKCAQYITASRLYAINLISLADGSTTGINAAALGLSNSNGQCSGGITVTEAAGLLTIRGDAGTLGAAPASRRFIMTRAAANGAWSCQTTDSVGTVIQAGSCTKLNN
jgi:prepilin-type N-terminal cleavage/methylation domain-containing protein